MQVAARQLLSGTVQPPPEADVLLRILRSGVFSGNATGGNYDDLYVDVPVIADDDTDRHDDFSWNRDAQRNSERSDLDSGYSSRNRASMGNFATTQQSSSATAGRNRASTWGDDREYWERHRADPSTTFDAIEHSVPQQPRSARFQNRHSAYSDDTLTSRSKGPPPGRPTAPKPVFKPAPKPTPGVANQAVALYTFAATQDGDLGFKKGDIITIIKRTESKNVSSYHMQQVT